VRTYRVALLGCGPRGAAQAVAIALHPRMELVAVCDLLPEHRDAVGDRVGVAARYDDFSRMIREHRPDIVNVAVATRFHAPLAAAVLRMGCHVDVEKPLTLTLTELDAVMAAQRESGKQLAPHHQAAVHPPASKLRQMVRAGAIGEPRAVRLRNKGYYGGYGIIHQGCHALALAVSVVGPARAVSAHMTTGRRPTTADDVFQGPEGYGLVAGEHLTCLYDLANGAYLVDEEHQRQTVDSGTVRFEIVGTDGALALDHTLPTVLYHSDSPHWHPVRTGWTRVPLSAAERTVAGFDFEDPAVRYADIWMCEEWVRALDEGRDHLLAGSVGADTMEMIHGAYASHAEGRRVALPLADRAHPLERWLERAGRGRPPAAPFDYAAWLPWAQARPLRPRRPGPRRPPRAEAAGAARTAVRGNPG
jgi:predicted dehydrogenase